jgi:hypothetical protein
VDLFSVLSLCLGVSNAFTLSCAVASVDQLDAPRVSGRASYSPSLRCCKLTRLALTVNTEPSSSYGNSSRPTSQDTQDRIMP